MDACWLKWLQTLRDSVELLRVPCFATKPSDWALLVLSREQPEAAASSHSSNSSDIPAPGAKGGSGGQ
eukprot:3200865-Lingulodinium_polyedra.AAC.1